MFFVMFKVMILKSLILVDLVTPMVTVVATNAV